MQKLYIILFISICFLLVACTTDKMPEQYTPQEITFDGDALVFQTGLNEVRASYGAQSLRGEKLLTDLCEQHCLYMIENDTLSHAGFYERHVKSHAVRIGECCSYNYINPLSSLNAYELSKLHLGTLTNTAYKWMGYAKIGKYECVILACYENGKLKLSTSIKTNQTTENINGGTITSFESN